MTSSINNAFQKAADARQALEDDYTKANEEAFEEARGAFRMTVIAQVRSEVNNYAEMYTALAEDISELHEVITALDKWFTNNGLHSDVNPVFIRDTLIPPPLRGIKRDYCGTKTKLMSTEVMTDEAVQMFNGTYRYYDDQERMPPPPGSQHKNKAKDFNSALGR